MASKRITMQHCRFVQISTLYHILARGLHSDIGRHTRASVLTSGSSQTFCDRIEQAFRERQLLRVELLIQAANLHAHDSGSAKDGI